MRDLVSSMQRTEAGLLLLIHAVVITNQIRFFFFTGSPRGVAGKVPFEEGTLFLILPAIVLTHTGQGIKML